MGKREDEIIQVVSKQLMTNGEYVKGNVQYWFNFKGRIGCWYQAKDGIDELKYMIDYLIENEQTDLAIMFGLALKDLEQYFIEDNINLEDKFI